MLPLSWPEREGLTHRREAFCETLELKVWSPGFLSHQQLPLSLGLPRPLVKFRISI